MAPPRAAPSLHTRAAGVGPLLLALALLAACLALVHHRLEPPPALPVDAPAERFSAGRALERLARLVGDDQPHPVGSAAAERVRGQLLAEFTALGLAGEAQRALACSARGASCGAVGNVLARLPGRVEGPAVLVSAHHDSVPAGPGAGDDGAGVAAVLELARALSLGPAPRNPVVFLLVDGEEAGLLGAQAFVDEHRWAKHIGVAVNLDAGGTRGVTSITRTSPGNALMLDAFAEVAVPYGASVIGAVYGLTPYDTDFSVYNRAEIRSIDLGFGEDKAHYHTPLDRLGNLDPASVQHLGDTALALVRRLADADLDAAPDGERVFLDALGLAMIAWPAPWTAGLALLAVLLMAFATWRLRHVFGDIIERAPSPDLATPAAADGKVGRLAVGPATAKVALRRRLLAVLALPLLIAVPAAAASGLAWLLAWLTGAEAPGHAQPWPARLAVWSTLLLASGLVAAWLRVRLGPARLNLALWWPLTLLAALLALAAPAASVGALPPVLLAAAIIAWSSRHARKDMSKWPGPATALLCLLLPALMWLQAATRVEAIFGIGPVASVVLALLLALLAPLWPTRARACFVLLAVLGASASAWTVAVPAYTEARPRRLSLVFHQDVDSGAARWLVDGDLPLPPALREAGAFAADRELAFAWTPADEPSWTAPAAPVPALAPTLTLEPEVPEVRGAWGRYLKLRLRSPRGARSAALVIPDAAGVRWLAIAGKTVPRYPEHRREWYRDVRHHPIVAIPPEGLVVELVIQEQAPVELTILDVSEGLPPAGAPLELARPAWAVPSHAGDRTVLSRRLSF